MGDEKEKEEEERRRKKRGDTRLSSLQHRAAATWPRYSSRYRSLLVDHSHSIIDLT
jgi:hypothetical protein